MKKVGFLLLCIVALLLVTSCGTPKEIFTVTFDSGAGAYVAPATVKGGECVEEPSTPVRVGYDFLGWYLGDAPYDFTTPVTSNITLVAKWESVSVHHITITYYHYDGRVTSAVVDKRQPVTLPTPTVTEGVVYEGWYDAAGVAYTGDVTFSGDVTLYESLSSEGLTITDGTVAAYTGTSASVIIPHYYQGGAVTTIGEGAFSYQNITSLILPVTLKHIEREAFCGCTSLLNVDLKNVETIGERAFYNCVEFISLEIPATVEKIGFSAFGADMTYSELETGEGTYLSSTSKLRSLTINAIVGDNPDTAFIAYWFGALTPEYLNYYEDGIEVEADGETKLANVVYCLPTALEYISVQGVENIPQKAFFNCFYVTELQLGTSVQMIGESAFEGCLSATFTGLENVVCVEKRAFLDSGYAGEKMLHLEYIGDMAFARSQMNGIVTLPETLTYIGKSAFSYTDISQVVFPRGIEYIGDTAFFGCNLLKNVYFMSPEPCEIGDSLFTAVDEDGTVYYSTALIYVPTDTCYPAYREDLYLREYAASIFPLKYDGRKGYIVQNGVLLGYIGEERLEVVEVPDGVTEIADFAFYNRRDIRDVVMPEGFERIGKYAFYNCTSVQTLYMSSTLKEIDDYAFTGFFVGNNLSRLYFPEGFERIGEGAFMSSFNLKIVEFPTTLTEIGYLAFGMANSLERMTFASTLPPSVGTFENDDGESLCEIFSIINGGKTVIYVPSGRIDGTLVSDLYKSADGFKTFASYVKATPNGKEVGHYGNGEIFIDLDGCDMVVWSTLVECEVDTSGNGGTRYEYLEKRGSYTLAGNTLTMTFADGEVVTATYVANSRSIVMIQNGMPTAFVEPTYYYDSYNWTTFKLYATTSSTAGKGVFDMYGSFITPFEWNINGEEFVITVDGNNQLPEHADYADTKDYTGTYNSEKNSFSVTFMLNDYEALMNFSAEKNQVVYATGEMSRFYGTYKYFAPNNPDFAMYTFVSYGNGVVDIYIGEQLYAGCTYTMEDGVITIDMFSMKSKFTFDGNGHLKGKFYGANCLFLYVDELLDSTKLPSRNDGVEVEE